MAINGPVSTDIVEKPFTVHAETANYTVFTYQKTNQRATDWTLVFDAISDSQKQLINNFFYNVAIGPTNTFTYEHSDGNTYTARLLDDRLQWRRLPNQWALTLRLRINSVEVV